MRKTLLIAILLSLSLCLTAQGQAAHNWEVNVQGILGGHDGIAHGYGGEVAFLPLRTGPVRWGASVGVRRVLAPYGENMESATLDIMDHYWCVPVMLKGEWILGSARNVVPFLSLSAGYTFSSGISLTVVEADGQNNFGFCFEPQAGLCFAQHFYAAVGLWGQSARHGVYAQKTGMMTYELSPVRLVDFSSRYLLLAATLRLGVWF